MKYLINEKPKVVINDYDITDVLKSWFSVKKKHEAYKAMEKILSYLGIDPFEVCVLEEWNERNSSIYCSFKNAKSSSTIYLSFQEPKSFTFSNGNTISNYEIIETENDYRFQLKSLKVCYNGQTLNKYVQKKSQTIILENSERIVKIKLDTDEKIEHLNTEILDETLLTSSLPTSIYDVLSIIQSTLNISLKDYAGITVSLEDKIQKANSNNEKIILNYGTIIDLWQKNAESEKKISNDSYRKLKNHHINLTLQQEAPFNMTLYGLTEKKLRSISLRLMYCEAKKELEKFQELGESRLRKLIEGIDN